MSASLVVVLRATMNIFNEEEAGKAQWWEFTWSVGKPGMLATGMFREYNRDYAICWTGFPSWWEVVGDVGSRQEVRVVAFNGNVGSKPVLAALTE